MQSELPARKAKQELLGLLRSNQVVVVCGDTGSGKSTQIPQFLLEEGLISPQHKLAVTQPRRLAAVALAARVAEEQKTPLGTTVGYSVRFDDRSSSQTAVKFVTEGVLLRELLADRKLQQYGAIMLDETHERTINVDMIMGLLRDLLKERSELKLILSSATLDSKKVSNFFTPPAPVFSISGKSFPVEVNYLKTKLNPGRQALVDAVQACVLQIHTEFPLNFGDILVFLSGQDVIRECAAAIETAIESLNTEIGELQVLQLFSGMPEEEQKRVFLPPPANCRRVILATNIAETSVTLPRIRFVVDSGIEKQKLYDIKQGVEVLAEAKCSKASAKQRMGRAGRVSAGICYRLYTQQEFETRFPTQSEPELLRSNLSSVALMLMTLGAGASLLEFNWLDKPDFNLAVDAMQTLYALGAVNSDFKLTKLGRVMAEFPVDPKLAKCLVAAGSKHGNDMCVIAAMLTEHSNLFEKRAQADEEWRSPLGDHISLLNLYRLAEKQQFSRRFCKQNGLSFRTLQRVKHVAAQLQLLLARVHPLLPMECKSVIEAIVSGYFLNTARSSHNRRDYIALRLKETVYVHPSSTLFKAEPPADLLVFHELMVTSKEYMRGCLRISAEILKAVAPQFTA